MIKVTGRIQIISCSNPYKTDLWFKLDPKRPTLYLTTNTTTVTRRQMNNALTYSSARTICEDFTVLVKKRMIVRFRLAEAPIILSTYLNLLYSIKSGQS